MFEGVGAALVKGVSKLLVDAIAKHFDRIVTSAIGLILLVSIVRQDSSPLSTLQDLLATLHLGGSDVLQAANDAINLPGRREAIVWGTVVVFSIAVLGMLYRLVTHESEMEAARRADAPPDVEEIGQLSRGERREWVNWERAHETRKWLYLSDQRYWAVMWVSAAIFAQVSVISTSSYGPWVGLVAGLFMLRLAAAALSARSNERHRPTLRDTTWFIPLELGNSAATALMAIAFVPLRLFGLVFLVSARRVSS